MGVAVVRGVFQARESYALTGFWMELQRGLFASDDVAPYVVASFST